MCSCIEARCPAVIIIMYGVYCCVCKLLLLLLSYSVLCLRNLIMKYCLSNLKYKYYIDNTEIWMFSTS